MVKLFVSGFPLDIEEIELVKLFSLHGDVKTIKLVRNKQTRVCKGYGFIEMADQASAENAVIALDGQLMGDRALTVNIRPDEPVVKTPVYSRIKKTNEPLRQKRPRRMQ